MTFECLILLKWVYGFMIFYKKKKKSPIDSIPTADLKLF